MTYSEKDIKEIADLYNKIESNKEHEYSAPTYKDSADIARIAKLAMSADDTDKETLENKIIALSYVTECYDSMCRSALSCIYYGEILKAYSQMPKLTKKQKEDFEGELYHAFKARNKYAYDPCDDFIEAVSNIISKEKAAQLLDDASRHCKMLAKNDPVELTKAYLDVIDEVEMKIDELTHGQRGMGFCHKYWALKADFLMEKGIIWQSPAILNPGTRFD